MNTKSNKKKSDVPSIDEIQTLDIILDLFENGDLDMSFKARQCYLTEQHKALNQPTWLHNDQLINHLQLRKMGKRSAKDLLRK